MVVPNRDPGKRAVAEEQVLICSVGCVTLTIIIQSVDFSIGQGYAANGITPAVSAILVLVDVISQVEHVIDRVLPHRVPVSIEESEGEITAGIHS